MGRTTRRGEGWSFDGALARNKKDFTIDASTNETIIFEFSPDEAVPSRQIMECGVHVTCFDPRTKKTSNFYTLARLAAGKYGKGPWA